MSALVSLILPVFNAQGTLESCLGSILSQSHRTLEVICVDDGSTDASAEILRACARKEDRIRVFHRSNGGQGAARNLGVDASRGDYIAFVDADDGMHPECIRMNLSLAERHAADLVSFSFREVDQAGDLPSWPLEGPMRSACIERPLRQVRGTGWPRIGITVWSKLYSRDAIRRVRFLEASSPYEDVHHTLCMVKGEIRTVVHDTPLYAYTRAGPSSTRRRFTPPLIHAYRAALEGIARHYEDDAEGWTDISRRVLWRYYRRQWKQIAAADKADRASLLDAFGEQLAVMQARGGLRWCLGNLRWMPVYLYLIRRRKHRPSGQE